MKSCAKMRQNIIMHQVQNKKHYSTVVFNVNVANFSPWLILDKHPTLLQRESCNPGFFILFLFELIFQTTHNVIVLAHFYAVQLFALGCSHHLNILKPAGSYAVHVQLREENTEE